MNNKNIIRILVLVTVGLFFLAVYSGYLLYTYSASPKKAVDASQKTEVKQGKVEITEFKADKPVYSSHEKIELEINLIAETEVENAEIKITGIKPHQVAYIKEEKIVDLPKGETTISVEAQAPSCTSGCGGVYPGPYDINAEVLIEEVIIDSWTTTIELVEG
jgi:hypothetical protein